MSDLSVKQPVLDVFSNRGKWRELLSRFEEALKLNIWLVDAMGHVLIPPWQERGKRRFGAGFLEGTFGVSLSLEKTGFLDSFKQKGSHREAVNPFDFRLLTVPLQLPGIKTPVHIVIGPMILGAPWPDEKYTDLNNRLNLAAENFLEEVRAIPCLSEPAAIAVLNLLCEVVKDILELDLKNKNSGAYNPLKKISCPARSLMPPKSFMPRSERMSF